VEAQVYEIITKFINPGFKVLDKCLKEWLYKILTEKKKSHCSSYI